MTVFDYQPTFNKTVLNNGVRIVTEHHPHTRASCAAIYVVLGSRDEPKDLNGAAHFIEHLVFKGTKKRSALDIVKDLEAVGGEINAYTTKEYTCFHATTLRENLELSLDVLVDLVGGASFAQKDFDLERDVISQEIAMSADQLEEYIFDLYFENAYQGSKLGQPILGTEKSLSHISRKELFKYYNDHYISSNILVSVAGDVDHDEVVKFVQKKLGQKYKRPPKKTRKSSQPKPFMKKIERTSEQVHVLLGYPTASFKDDERFESYLVNAVLGGGMTSRLYQKIREKQALTYNVYSYLHAFTDSGLMMLYAATTADKVKKVLNAFEREVNNLLDKRISSKELMFFKKQIMGQLLLGADDIENRMNSIAVNEMIFSKYTQIFSFIKKIRNPFN